ncbi:MAG: hypothetical protein H8E44_02825 [Planctomycetes bacterium]|nr:hypothetical protein [Planctomycetota bacterium]MBL7043593.1 hypothetical protein [Pirellulaceae bacterium]
MLGMLRRISHPAIVPLASILILDCSQSPLSHCSDRPSASTEKQHTAASEQDARGVRPPGRSQAAITRLGREFHVTVENIGSRGRPRYRANTATTDGDCRDDDLALLKSIENLKELYLWDPVFTDRCAEHVASVTGLELLSIQRTYVTDAGLARLATLPKLKELHLVDSHGLLTDRGLACLAKLRSLQRLTLSGPQFSDEAGKHVGKLTNLQFLEFGGGRITDRVFARIAPLKSLEELRIASYWRRGNEVTGITGVGISRLRLKSLKKLELSGPGVTGRGLEVLADIPSLRSLDLQDAHLNDRGLRALSKVSQLRSLNLSRQSIGDDGLAELSALANLEELVLDGTSVSDSGLRHLASLVKLRRLSLRRTQGRICITDAGLRHLTGLKELEELDLYQTGVTDTGIANLKSLKKLTTLSLQNTAVTEPAKARLCEALPRLIIR